MINMWNKHRLISLSLNTYVTKEFDNYPKDIINVINKTYYNIDKVKIRCGGNYTYMILSPNDVYCWGIRYRYFYEFDDNKPTKMGLKNVDDLYCGVKHGFAITNNYTSLYGWGYNFFGQLGLENTKQIPSDMPLKIEFSQFDIRDIRKIVCGEQITFFLLHSGCIYSVGIIDDIFGKYKREDNYHIPKLLCLPLAKDIGMHTRSVFVVTAEGGFVYCWGMNTSGQLCIGSKESYVAVPTKMETIKDAYRVICGSYHTFVLTNSDRGYCFGCNDNGELMYNGKQMIKEPKPFKLGAIKDIYCSQDNTFVITKKGNVLSWGRNYEGQLGNGTRDILPTLDPFNCYMFMDRKNEMNKPYMPNKYNIVNIKNAYDINCGEKHVFVTTTNGEIYCWGNNYNGQLGFDNFDNYNYPQKYTTNIDKL